jgi:hypothetical protein
MSRVLIDEGRAKNLSHMVSYLSQRDKDGSNKAVVEYLTELLHLNVCDSETYRKNQAKDVIKQSQLLKEVGKFI